ncbi:hypothetical protein CYMTET_10153 [Cymbomonas tetramitiformis]|uniref:Uncharacterized protein n=1 Tax=Cymbomonas tetramitiformis TaxID=36881 RepID=A0AAE0LER8_9CHLO|nr:hypothetical protein CYMTET_10153 [Cymbomonas tetramitiformis]
MGTRDNALCDRETCVTTYVKKPTSFTYGTCGLLSCAQNRFVYQLRENNLKRVRRNFCAISQHLLYCLPVECDAEAYGFERCRLCATTFHRSCALTLFLEGDYAFKLDPSAQLICSNCLLVLPQTVIVFSTVASALANNGTPLKYLVVIPTHTTAAANIQYRALQDASSEFDGLTFAWLGDALMDTEDSGLSGTPAAQRDPSRAAILALKEDLVTTATRERAARTPSMRSRASESVDTPEGSIPESNYGLSPVHMDANLRVGVDAPAQPAASRASLTAAAPAAERAWLCSSTILLRTCTWSLSLPRRPLLPPSRLTSHPIFVPRRSRRLFLHAPVLRLSCPLIPSTLILLPPFRMRPDSWVRLRYRLLQATFWAASYMAEETRRLEQQRQAAAGITFDLLLTAVAPKDGVEGLVTGDIDGLSVTDLDSPSAMRREMRENYSGNGTTKVDKLIMRRLMQVDTLGDSAELQHTPLRVTQESLTMSGNKLQVRDRLQFPRQDRFLTYCRKRTSEWSTIQRSGLGVFAPAHQSHVFHHRTALLVQARYGFMIELVEHAGLEWP